MVRLDNTTKTLYSQWGTFNMDNGFLCREWYPQGTGRLCAASGGSRILQPLHSSSSCSYLDRTKTLLLVQQRFYWPYYKDVIHWCKRCDTCARSKSRSSEEMGPTRPCPTRCPLERVAIEIMGPLSRTENGYQLWLEIISRNGQRQ